MSMLAEPRRKQKLSSDPRGSHWSKDDSKFGQKMLEKFGWSKGKGLGAKEDGHVEHVKVSVKNNMHGVGCSGSYGDTWIAHQDDFNALLSSLNQSNTAGEGKNQEKVISLENKSKTSKSRVHYQKFTKGKDLSAKSSKDLDCIFGRRSTKAENPKEEEVQDDENKATPDDKVEGGFVTIKSEHSIQDYFKQKMAGLKNSPKRSASEPLLHSILKGNNKENSLLNEDESSNDSFTKSSKRVSFYVSESDEQAESKDLSNETEEKEKKKKKKSKKRKLEAEEATSQEQEDVPIKKKKKKKSKNKDKNEISEVDVEEGNCDMDEMDDSQPELRGADKDDTFNESAVEDRSISKGKKRKKKKDKVKQDSNDSEKNVRREKTSKKNRSECNEEESSETKDSEKNESGIVKKKESTEEKRQNKTKLKECFEDLELKWDPADSKLVKVDKDLDGTEKVPESIDKSKVIESIEKSFKGSSIAEVKGYAVHSGYDASIEEKLRKKELKMLNKGKRGRRFKK